MELGERHVAIARVAGAAGGRPETATTAVAPIAGDAPFGDAAGLAAWTAALREARRGRNGGPRDAVISLPASQVDSFPLRLEATDSRAFVQELASQAAERLPYPVNEAVVDCIELADAGAAGGKRVILVAARAAVVRFALDCAAAAGLEPRAIEIPATALARVHQFVNGPEAGGALIVHPGEAGTSIACVRSGSVLVTRSIPWGLTSILSQLEQTLRIPRPAALRVLAGYRPGAMASATATSSPPASAARSSPRTERVLAALLAPALEELAGEVEKVWTYARSEFRSRGPEAVLLSGRAALAPAIGSYLATLNPEPVGRLDPWTRIASDCGGATPDGDEGPSLAVAIGLALRGASWPRRN